MSQLDSSKRSKRTICREQSQHGPLGQLVTQLIIPARYLSAKKPWSWVFAALLILAIHAPARADKPCSGGDDSDARPIAATLQPNASAFNPNGRFEVTMQSSGVQTTDIYVRHSVGSKEIFRAITRLQSAPSAVVVGRLPASEGLGFSLEVAEGGSGLMQICTYGFRFQHGVVSYRTLAARAETRGGGRSTGEVTDWKSVLTHAQRSQSPPTGAPLDRLWLGKWKGREQRGGSGSVSSLDISPTAIKYRRLVGDEGQYSMVTTKYKWSSLQDGLRARAVPSGSFLFSSSQQTRSKADVVKEFESNKVLFADVPGSASARRTENEAIQRMGPGRYPVILLYTNGEINELVLEGDHVWFLPGDEMGTELFNRVPTR